MNYREKLARYYVQCSESGLNYSEAETLRRAAMTLHRWHEGECGNGDGHSSWAIERDETTGVPYFCRYPHNNLKPTRTRIPDRERGALKRIAAIVAKLPGASFDVQGDPRGWPLTITLQDGRTLCPPLRY